MIDQNQKLVETVPAPSPQILLKQYQQSLTGIVTQLRIIVHNIHEESGNPFDNIKLYLIDVKQKMKHFESEIKNQQEQNKEKSEEIAKLKLQVKAMQNDYSEMKSSLFLEVEEQKLIINRMREEMNREKQLQQTTIKQLMVDIERKNEEIKYLRQDYEEQISEYRGRVEGLSISSIKSIEEIEEEGQKQRLRVMEIESQREKTLINYTQLINKQRQEIKSLLLRLKESNQSDENKEVIGIIQHQSDLMGKIQELETSLLSKEQQISKISILSKSENRKCRQYFQRLRVKEEEAEDLKNKMSRFTRDSTIKESEIAQLRTTLQKIVKERQESSKYMGTKWEHQIDRVLLNAELQFDREKNRLKKAAQERQQEVEDELNDKINKLKAEVKLLKENKTKLIEKVKELEDKMKMQGNQAVMKIEKLKEELSDITNTRNILIEELGQLKLKYEQTCKNLKIAISERASAVKELKQYKDSFENNKKKIEDESVQKIQIIKKEVEVQKQKVVEKSKEEHVKLINSFNEKEKRLNIEIQQKLKIKQKSLFQTVQDLKKQQQDTIKIKLLEIEEVKEETRKQFEKSLKSAKKQFNQVNEENIKVKVKMQKQLKDSIELSKVRQEEIAKHKQRIQELLLQNKTITDTLCATTKQKDNAIQIKQSVIESKIQQYNNLFEQKANVDRLYKELLTKYGFIKGEITQLKESTLKQIASLVQQHDKMIKGYKSYIRQLQDNCFTHSDIMVYVRQIKKLRQVNTQAETDLANMESKLLTLKQVSKYQVTKIEESIKTQKFNSTIRSLTRGESSQKSLVRKSTDNSHKFTRYNQSSGFTHYGSIDNLQGATHNLNIQNSNNTGYTGYQKLSRHKKRLGTAYQKSRMKKSRVGFTEIDTYSILANSKQQYRFNSLASPEAVRCVRSALNK